MSGAMCPLVELLARLPGGLWGPHTRGQPPPPSVRRPRSFWLVLAPPQSTQCRPGQWDRAEASQTQTKTDSVNILKESSWCESAHLRPLQAGCGSWAYPRTPEPPAQDWAGSGWVSWGPCVSTARLGIQLSGATLGHSAEQCPGQTLPGLGWTGLAQSVLSRPHWGLGQVQPSGARRASLPQGPRPPCWAHGHATVLAFWVDHLGLWLPRGHL